ncbi:MAG: TolC family protein [Gemmatimonadota bacterium]
MKPHRILALALLLAPATAGAQDGPPLSLEEALRMGRANNPGFQQRLNDEEMSTWDVRGAYENFLSIGVRPLTLSGRRNTQVNNAAGRAAVTSESSTASQNLNASLSLDARRWNSLQTARTQKEEVVRTTAAEAFNLDVRVTRAYYRAQSAEAQIELAQRQLGQARQRLSETEEKIPLAAASAVDLQQAQLDVLSREQQVANAEGTARSARLALATELGVGGAGDWELTTEVLDPFDPSSLDPNALVDRALRENRMLQAQEVSERLAEQRSTLARRTAWWPSLGLSWGLSRNAFAADYGAFGEVNPNDTRQSSLSLTVSLPFLSPVGTSANIATSAMAATDAQHLTRAQRLNVERNVRTAIIQLENAWRSLQIADQTAVVARQQLELAEEQLRLGVLSSLAFQQVIDRAAQAEVSALNARFDFLNRRLDLEQELGGPIDPQL